MFSTKSQRSCPIVLMIGAMFAEPAFSESTISFDRDIRPILTSACLHCHGPDEESREAGLRLDTLAGATAELESGARAIVPGNAEASEAVKRLTHHDGDLLMPPPESGKTVTPQQIEMIRRWIDQGAEWEEHWGFRALRRPPVPRSEQAGDWARNPIDAFILEKHREHGLSAAPAADRFTLIRRLYFDLIGLPPTPEEIEAFVADPDPLAYEKLVTKLLDSPHYGERWARHWLDVVKYADTHGYDKDKLRPNAWPYRDYVIRSFNEDKPYAQFVREQIAGDVFSPGDPDGTIALGFIAAGPWDFIGHVEVPESKIDGKVARNLDRDDMVCNTLNTFSSLTIQCARCHDHRFDPFTMEHYYSLQAVFAGVDRADREVPVSKKLADRKAALEGEIASLRKKQQAMADRLAEAGGERLKELNRRLVEMRRRAIGLEGPPEHGWHSALADSAEVEKWVQVDLGESVAFDRVVMRPCHDDFAGIGAGFGFPPRFKVSCSDDPEFRNGGTLLHDATTADVPNPKLAPFEVSTKGAKGRFVRVTAKRLFNRNGTFLFSLAELEVCADGKNLALGAKVTSLDSIEAPIRWQRSNLIDGKFPVEEKPGDQKLIAHLEDERASLLAEIETEEIRAQRSGIEKALAEAEAALKKIPAGKKVYAATVHRGKGNFRGRDGLGPREIRILRRGEVTQPGQKVGPGTVPLIGDRDWRFELPENHDESARRAALAEWLIHRENPLTWRSIVNRVWQHHFGNGIVASPNDFGRNGSPPTHPELLDWLAVEFRDGGQSLKKLHRLIVTSSTYRQQSAHREAFAEIDGDNKYLWRMNRRRLDAESLRDSILSVSGKLDRTMFGPGFYLFGLERTQHSPHYQYHQHDPNDPASHRRSIYRFIVRSQPHPFMSTLDCADSSQSTPKRTETITAIQALSLLNNKFNLAMAENFAARVTAERDSTEARVQRAYRLATGREPDPKRLQALTAYAENHGLANACRLLFNLNAFIFVD
ncbi:MAG TPA: DUF1553 domain-containing protein [Opitutales bacterium]|nr:DUF1553 domain-containing protein [Opitutales bacterium]